MDQSYAWEAREKGIVEIFLDAVPRLVAGLSQQQDLGSDRAGCGGAGLRAERGPRTVTAPDRTAAELPVISTSSPLMPRCSAAAVAPGASAPRRSAGAAG